MALRYTEEGIWYLFLGGKLSFNDHIVRGNNTSLKWFVSFIGCFFVQLSSNDHKQMPFFEVIIIYYTYVS